MEDPLSPRTVIAKITTKPGHRDDAVQAFAPLLAAASAESGTLTYRIYLDRKNDAVIWFFEEYADKVGFDAHMNSETMRRVGAAAAPFLVAPPEFAFVQPALPTP
jgi:quinol monooxygenase YgiN